MALINNGYNNRGLGRYLAAAPSGGQALARPFTLGRTAGIPSSLIKATSAKYLIQPYSAATFPATLTSLTGWWRATWPSPLIANTWKGVPSYGSSTTRNLSEATNPPAAGVTVGTRVSAAFNGTTSVLTNASDFQAVYCPQAAASGWCLFNAATAGADAGAGLRIDNDGLLCMDTGSAVFGLGFSTSGVCVDLFDSSATYKEINTAFPTGQWCLAQWKYDGTNLKLRLNNRAWTSLAAGTAAAGTGGVVMGRNYNTAFADVSILEAGLANVALTDTNFNDIGAYVETYYGLDLGFQAPPMALFPDYLPGPRAHARYMQNYGNPSFQPPAATAPTTAAELARYPASIDRRSLHASQLAASVVPHFPDPRKTQYAEGISQHAISRLVMAASVQLAVTNVPPKPEAKVPAFSVQAPDRIDRRAMHASAQLAVTSVPPKPDIRTSQWVNAVAPSTIVRCTVLTAHQPFVAAPSPFPDTRKVQWSDAIFPSAIDRRVMLPAHQMAPAALPAFPDTRKVQWAAVTAPVTIDRRVMLTAAQLAVTSLSPLPIPNTALIPVLFATFPDAVARLSMPASTRLAFVTSSLPDIRTTQWSDAIYPAAIGRLTMPTASQLAVTSLSPQPIPNAALVSVLFAAFPDAIDRRSMLASSQQSTALPAFPDPRTVQFSGAVVPVAIDRRVMLAAHQIAPAALPPLPDIRKTQWSDAIFPVKIDRRVMLSATQLAVTGIPPKPEALIVLGGQPTFPSAIDRRAYLTATQLAFATSPLPDPRTVQWSDATFPITIDRRTFGASSQMALAALPPKPDTRTVQFSDAIYPAAVNRRVMLTAAQLAVTSLSPLPIPNTALVPVLFATFPDRIDRLTFNAARQLAFALPPKPDLRTVQWSDAIYPTAIDRRVLPTAAQLAITSVSPLPRPLISVLFATFPDRIDSRTFRAADQMAAAARHHLPDPRTVQFSDAIYPTAIDRRVMPTAAQLAVLSVPPFPQPLISVLFATFPDAIERRSMLAVSQQAFALQPFPDARRVPYVGPELYPAWLPTRRALQPSAVVETPRFDSGATPFYDVVAPHWLPHGPARAEMYGSPQLPYVTLVFVTRGVVYEINVAPTVTGINVAPTVTDITEAQTVTDITEAPTVTDITRRGTVT